MGFGVDDGPLAERAFVDWRNRIFRLWFKWWVSVQEGRKCFVVQWGLTDTLSASQLRRRWVYAVQLPSKSCCFAAIFTPENSRGSVKQA
jgi:hypothetical protein